MLFEADFNKLTMFSLQVDSGRVPRRKVAKQANKRCEADKLAKLTLARLTKLAKLANMGKIDTI